MRNLFNKTGLAGSLVNTAYDKIVEVASNLDKVISVADYISDGSVDASIAAVASTAADVVTTNADVVLTHADVVLTGNDVVTTNADVVTTNANVALTNADVVTVQGIYDSFDDRYLGAKDADPALDNDGNALIDGALYENNVTKVMKVYDLGTTTWSTVNPSNAAVDINVTDTAGRFTGANSEDVLTEVALLAGDAAQPFNASEFIGPLTGNAATATNATNATNVSGGTVAGTFNIANTGTAISGLSAGTIGTYIFATTGTLSSSIVLGGTFAGSNLDPAGLYTNVNSGSSTDLRSFTPTLPLTGTWRCMGYAHDASGFYAITLWLRIS